MALYEWVSNTDERRRLQVERAANELKQKILLESSNQKAASLKPTPTNNSAMNGGCSTVVVTAKTKEGDPKVVAAAASSAEGPHGDNNSRASSSGRSSTKSSGSAAPIQQQIPSATLTNVTGSDLAKEVREILKNQKLAAETQKQQQQEHHQQKQLQLQQQKLNQQRKVNGHGGQTPASGNSNSSTVTPISSIQDLTASTAAMSTNTAASALTSAFSVGSGQDNRSSGTSSSQNSGGTVQVFAGLEEIARHSRIRQKVMSSGVFHDHGGEDEDDSCTGVDSNILGDDMTKSQQRQNHDRDALEDGGDVSVSTNKPTTSNRSRRIPTNTNRQALPMTIQTKKRLRWHALVDSGMGRLGFKTDPVSKDDQGKRRDTVEILKELVDLEVALDCPIEFYGMCTHMADASNSTSTFTDSQMNKFKSLLKRVRNAGISVPTISTDNSAALLTTNLTHFTTNAKELLAQTDADSRGFVRTGGAIYGQRPSFSQLRAVSTLMASVRHVATLKEGESVGYDRAYVAPMNVRIATLTIGFADGYPRELGNGLGRVSIRGHLFPVAGNVCMDMLMVELGPAGDKHGIGAQVVVGDTAVLWGPDDGEEGEGHVRLQDVAATLKTTQSALTCGLNKERVLRQYA
jgi:alanine racemase